MRVQLLYALRIPVAEGSFQSKKIPVTKLHRKCGTASFEHIRRNPSGLRNALRRRVC